MGNLAICLKLLFSLNLPNDRIRENEKVSIVLVDSKGSFLELCRQSTVGGVGPKIASTIGRMRNAAQLDGGAKSGKCEDVAEALSKMTVLSLGRSAIEDVSPIARVKNLEILLLAENNIRDLSPLLSMPNLIDVNVDRNRFKLTCPFRDKSICTGID